MLFGAPPTNRSAIHEKYVSGLRLRVIRIGVKASVNITLSDELFFTSVYKKHILSSLQVLKDILVRYLVFRTGSDWYLLVKIITCATSGLVHSMAYIIETMAEA